MTSAKIIVTYTPSNTNDAGANYIIGIYKSDDLIIPIAWDDMVEQKKGSHKFHGRYINDPKLNTLRSSYNQSFLGDKAKTSSNIALFGANPTEDVYWNIWL